MSFIMYDVVLLILFLIISLTFLYRKKRQLKKEGALILYRTKIGMKMIDFIGGKYQKTLTFLSYISIFVGYLLMIISVYLIGKIVWIYVAYPQVVRAVKVPPIMPLIPYIDKIAPGLGLPEFYFTYWVVILGIIAITHEFAHGIFMRRYNIKIKSTGFVFFKFFPAFFGFFVEQDEQSMEKKRNFEQMAVLSAGTFANVLTAIVSFIIMWIFFMNVFIPSGIMFDVYASSPVEISSIVMVNSILLENPSFEKILNLVNEEGFSELSTGEKNYLTTKNRLEIQKNSEKYLALYDDAPAVKAELSRIISKVNSVDIKNVEELSKELEKYSPGDKITITGLTQDESGNLISKTDEIILAENPKEKGKAYLGIGYISRERTGVLGKIITQMSSFKDSNVYYKPTFEAGWFIYNLLWWLVLISLGVAVINMLPAWILDGGRFFYLTILSLTKNKKIAEKSFKYLTYLFLLLFLLLMVFWLKSLLNF